MDKEQPRNLTSREKRFLEQESFITEAIRRRKGNDGEKPKPTWQRFLESPGGAAIISAILVGIFSQMTTYTAQRATSEKELRDAYTKARTEMILVTQKDYLEQQKEIIKRAYELIGSSISASEDLITLSTGYSITTFDSASREAITKQRATTLEKYNTVYEQWRTEKGKLRLLLSYYNSHRPEVLAAWIGAEEAVTAYTYCTQRWYLELQMSQNNGGDGSICKKQKDEVWKNLDRLNSSLASSNLYSWESPDNLKATTENK